jgi:ATP:ADP antiporter, AAA family
VKVLIPAKRGEWPLFLSAFAVTFLVYLVYQVLRNAKAALVVTAATNGAMAIPYIQLWMLLPTSIVMTWVLSRLMRRFSAAKVFVVTTVGFLGYFIVFSAWLFPYRAHPLVYGSFFTMAELWKVAVVAILFWGFLNRRLMMEQAKRFYGALAFAGGVGALVAGPVSLYCMHGISFYLHPLSTDPWHHALLMVALVVAGSGIVLLLLFSRVARLLRHQESDRPAVKLDKLSVTGSVRALMSSRYLRTLAAILFFDYIAFNLGEIVFMGVLHQAHPDPNRFGFYLSSLNMVGALGTLTVTLFVAPLLLRRCPWVVAAIATPFAYGLSAAAFFGAIFLGAGLSLAVLLGSCMFIFSRVGKLGLLDPAKELAFVPLDDESQVKGKLVIDGLVGRFGRAGSSVIAIGLQTIPWLAVVVGLCTTVWLRATLSLGKQIASTQITNLGR